MDTRLAVDVTLRTEGGYEWMTTVGGDRVLVSKAWTAPRELEQREVQLTPQHAAMYRQLARLPHEEKAIAKFAGKYGPLSRGNFTEVQVFQGKPSQIAHAGSWGEWTAFISELLFWINIWDHVSQGNRSALHKYVSAKRPELHHGLRVCCNQILQAAPANQLSVARKSVCQALSRRLREEVSLIVIPASGEADCQFALRCQPETHTDLPNLAGAAWAQFAMSVVGGQQYRSCEVCGKSFPVSSDFGRSNRLYCGDTCKIQAHRLKRRKAIALAQSGKSPAAIAKELDSTTTRIKGWLSKAKETP